MSNLQGEPQGGVPAQKNPESHHGYQNPSEEEMDTSSNPSGRGVPTPCSSTSTSIAVGSAPEEDLYALADDPAPSPSGSASSSSSAINSSTAGTGMPGSFISSVSQEVPDRNLFVFDSNMDTYPHSMTSSIRQHVYEGGLRYHAFRDGKYAFPNDDVEQNRDDMKHTMTVMLCRGRYFYAPVEKSLTDGGKVLDLGWFLLSFSSWVTVVGRRGRADDAGACVYT